MTMSRMENSRASQMRLVWVGLARWAVYSRRKVGGWMIAGEEGVSEGGGKGERRGTYGGR